MDFQRMLRICTAASKTDDIRKARRSLSVALRWTDANHAPGWDVAEYHAMRRKCVRQARYYTARYLRNARARIKAAANA